MNTNSKKTNDELRQQLWELSYGLLEPEAEAALCAQIKSDPAIARLYSEVRLQADLVGVAARVEDSSLTITARTEAKVTKADKRARFQTSRHPNPASSAASSGWGTNWLAIAGTTALLLLLGFGLMRPDVMTKTVAKGEYYFTQVSIPATMTEGLSQTVEVQTSDVDNNGRSAELAVRLVDAEGRETFRKNLSTARGGRAEVQLPGDVLRRGARLQVLPADDRDERDRSGPVVSVELQIAQEKERTVLLLEKPFAEPGETVRFSMVDVKEFSKQTSLPATDELMVENKSGGDVVQPMWTADATNGVISGEFELPRNATVDGLAMRRREAASFKSFKQEQADTFEKAVADASGATQSKRMAAPLAAAQNSLAQTERRALELNRSSTARPANGAAVAGGAPGPGRGAEAGGQTGLAKAGAAGAGGTAPMFDAAAPGAPAPPRLETAAVGTDKELANKPGNDRALSESLNENRSRTTSSMMAREQQLGAALQTRKSAELNVPAELQGQSLVLVARRGDVVVARREIADFQESDSSPLELPPEVEGVVDVDFYLKADAKTPVYRQQVVRTSTRELQVAVEGLKESYAPGERVKLKLQVLDEQGQSAAAAVGVRVWNEVAVRATRVPLSLAEAFYAEDQVAAPADQALAALLPADYGTLKDLANRDAGKKQARQESLAYNAPPAPLPAPAKPSAETAEATPAPVALRQLGRTDEAESDASGEGELAAFDSDFADVVLADNRLSVQREYENAVAANQVNRLDQMRAFGRILMWAAAGLMLLVGLLLIARQPLRTSVWMPAVGVAAVSLALGIAWFLPPEPADLQLAHATPMAATPDTAIRDEAQMAPVVDAPAPPAELALPAPEAKSAAGATRESLSDQRKSLQALEDKTLEEKSKNRDADNKEAKAVPADAALANGPPDQRPGGVAPPGLLRNDADKPQATAPAPGIGLGGDKPAAKKSDTEREMLSRSAGGSLGGEALPDSIFWRPLSPIDSDGTLTIEFTMPAAESEYRLLIDAIGSGRMGGKQQLLICREP